MDVIVIGKETYKSAAAPQVLYCGASRVEAREVIAKSNLAWIYEVSSLPIRNYKRSTTAAPAAPAPEPVKEFKKQSQSKSK
jgi:hypothetical protein